MVVSLVRGHAPAAAALRGGARLHGAAGCGRLRAPSSRSSPPSPTPSRAGGQAPAGNVLHRVTRAGMLPSSWRRYAVARGCYGAAVGGRLRAPASRSSPPSPTPVVAQGASALQGNVLHRVIVPACCPAAGGATRWRALHVAAVGGRLRATASRSSPPSSDAVAAQGAKRLQVTRAGCCPSSWRRYAVARGLHGAAVVGDFAHSRHASSPPSPTARRRAGSKRLQVMFYMGPLVRHAASSWRRYAVARGCTVAAVGGRLRAPRHAARRVSDAVAAQGAKRLRVTRAGMLPSSWRRYAVARGCTVQQWVGDFAHRVTQLGRRLRRRRRGRGPSACSSGWATSPHRVSSCRRPDAVAAQGAKRLAGNVLHRVTRAGMLPSSMRRLRGGARLRGAAVVGDFAHRVTQLSPPSPTPSRAGGQAPAGNVLHRVTRAGMLPAAARYAVRAALHGAAVGGRLRARRVTQLAAVSDAVAAQGAKRLQG
uniref:Uncharacterized protein n=1 Tax=Heliothis virescens TaxID=7102 RepID=A0A2A4JRM2_HELVI